MRPPTRYTPTARLLHWVVAVAVVGQLALGFWMIQLPDTPPGPQARWFNLHKSIGIVLGAVILLRLGWRMRHPAPPLPERIPAWQRKTAKVVHGLLYACMIVIPISGFIGSSVTQYPIRFFGYRLPRWTGESPAVKEICSAIHLGAIVVFLVLIAIHVGKVLKHLLIDRDDIFHRMSLGRATGAATATPSKELAPSK